MLKQAFKDGLFIILFFVLTGSVSFANTPRKHDQTIRDAINGAHEIIMNTDWRAVRKMADENNSCATLMPLYVWLNGNTTQMSSIQKQMLLSKLYDISDVYGCSNI